MKYDERFDFTQADNIEGIKNIYIFYCDPEIKISTCIITLGIWHIIPSNDNKFIISADKSNLILYDAFKFNNMYGKGTGCRKTIFYHP